MNWKKLVIAGIAGGIVYYLASFIIGTIITAIWQFNVLELGGMRSVTDPIMGLFFAYPFVLAFCMAAVYQFVSPALKGTPIQKGKQFGAIVWLLAGLPSAFMVLASMNYPIGFHIDSFLGSIVYLIATALVIARLSE